MFVNANPNRDDAFGCLARIDAHAAAPRSHVGAPPRAVAFASTPPAPSFAEASKPNETSTSGNRTRDREDDEEEDEEEDEEDDSSPSPASPVFVPLVPRVPPRPPTQVTWGPRAPEPSSTGTSKNE